MKNRNSIDVSAGRGPWAPWQYVGLQGLPEMLVHPGSTAVVMDNARKSGTPLGLARDSCIAVIEATKAINRMMGKHELSGMPLGEYGNE